MARRILFDPRYSFVLPERTTWEVKRYLPLLAEKSGVSEEDLLLAFEQMPIQAVGDEQYRHRFRETEVLGLRDPRDRDLVALALVLDAPVWTHDRDLIDLAGIRTRTDRDLI